MKISDLQSRFLEDISVCDEELLEKYLETEEISTSDIRKVIKERKLFPCFFGSASKNDRCRRNFSMVWKNTARHRHIRLSSGQKVFKIARDDQGNRLSYMKITGGALKVKELLTTSKGNVAAGEDVWEEKADQIRIYSGARFELVKEVPREPCAQ